MDIRKLTLAALMMSTVIVSYGEQDGSRNENSITDSSSGLIEVSEKNETDDML